MPASAVVVGDDLAVRIGKSRAALSPSQAFDLAGDLIRGATRAIVVEGVAEGAEILARADAPHSECGRARNAQPVRA